MLEKGSIVRNLNDPDDGICIILDVREDRIEAYSETEDNIISLRQGLARIAPVNDAECTPALLQKLHHALKQYDAEQEEILLGKLVHYGNKTSEGEDHETAVRDYTEALQMHPNASSVRFARGGVYRRMRMWAEAEADFLALKDDTDYRRQAVVLAAFCRLLQDKPHGAVELLEEALRSDPTRRDAIEKAAEAHEKAADQHRERALEYRRRLEILQSGVNQMILFQTDGTNHPLPALPPLD